MCARHVDSNIFDALERVVGDGDMDVLLSVNGWTDRFYLNDGNGANANLCLAFRVDSISYSPPLSPRTSTFTIVVSVLETHTQ